MRPQQNSRMYYEQLEGRQGNESLKGKKSRLRLEKQRGTERKKNAEVDAQTDSGTLLNGTIEKTSCKYQG